MPSTGQAISVLLESEKNFSKCNVILLNITVIVNTKYDQIPFKKTILKNLRTTGEKKKK